MKSLQAKSDVYDPNWAFTRSDRRTDRSVRPVGPTGLSDWSVRRSERVNTQ